MITIDRTSSTSIQDQLHEQLRFQIASGQYKIDDRLPSTRKLARQLDVSFHTIRKVYQNLEREGILESRPGSGFVVRERLPLSKSERMERGAAIVHDTLQRLVGLGLSESEVEYVFQEQTTLLEASGPAHKLVAALPYQELADLCAGQIEQNLQQTVIGSTLEDLSRHQDADFAFTPHVYLKDVTAVLPRTDVIGIVTYVKPDALEMIARLLDDQTLAVITRYADAIRPLTSELRDFTSFSGQMLAASTEQSAQHIKQLLGQTDLVVFTPSCRRRLLHFLRETDRHVAINHVVSRESLTAIRQIVPA
jgi:GntR family transcriptional regulator